MKSRQARGTCLICKGGVTPRGVLRHSTTCLQSSGWPEGDKPSLLIKVRDLYDGTYWLLVLARRDALLDDLDRLLRDVWVECCGHLSAFTIDGRDYVSDEMLEGESMEVPLSGLVAPGSTFLYRYDFGTTTELALKVVAETPVAPPDGPLCLVARNNRPIVPCDRCGHDAEFMLAESMDEGGPHSYCRKCLASAEAGFEWVERIANSPRGGICGYVEDPVTAIRWYPPGWDVAELVPGDLEEAPDSVAPDEESREYAAEVGAAADAVLLDIGDEIDAFIGEEEKARGEEFAFMAGESVTTFCTFMYLFHGVEIREWDARTVRRCLLEEMVQNPDYPEEWPENFVPIICRFIARMEASGRITNAADLIVALEEAAPEFISAVTSPEKGGDQIRRILEKARDGGIDPNDTDALLHFIFNEYLEMAGVDPDDTERREEMTRRAEEELFDDITDDLRKNMCLIRCDEFCSRFEDDTVLDRCVSIVHALRDHPDAPLLRGDMLLWSAAVVYAACQDARLIRPGRGGPPLGREIGSFFGFEVSSIRSKVKALRGFLPAQ
ncbi:hypothetical protein E2N92_05340 [Methanofollis formosanus]|uniref:Uncharacterized protein n=1 Tax=Methanofollis formosanus TaxID=299308 RepID=A0A8G1A1V6_9EURY|nr:DUF6398 domain-containing protein [Methanofollis formosanus]QYZ78888.1 hypothetical protein E2N92_05340 [Methanofollis formosanus]